MPLFVADNFYIGQYGSEDAVSTVSPIFTPRTIRTSFV